jgi:PKD repeat protein
MPNVAILTGVSEDKKLFYMKKEFYTLIAVLCLASVLSVRAQDTTACNAGFNVNSSQHTANFFAYDSLRNIQHFWNFGDGAFLPFSSRNFMVSHYYSAPGRYTVLHAVRDSLGGGCFDSTVQVIVIDTAPVCAIYINALTVDSSHIPATYSFSAYPVGPNDTVKWYVNDSLVGTADSLSRSFGVGQYTVCAQLHGASGCNAASCFTFSVNSRDSSDTTHTPPPVDSCSISFSYTVNPSHPNEFHFIAHDSTGLDSLTWVISRPNDTLSTVILHGQDPIHVFTDTGCYRVDLFATTPAGCISFTEQLICIDSLPAAGYIASYPNPAYSQSNLDLKLDKDNTVYITVFNAMGHQEFTKVVAGVRGSNLIVLPIAGLPKGIYYVQIQYGGVTKHSKIQKL